MDKKQLNQEWATRVTNFKASGLTMSAWCSAHGLILHQLKYWLRKTAEQSNEVPLIPSTKWIPLVVKNKEVPSSQVQPLVIRVGHADIEVAAGFDADLLRLVVRALEVPC